MDNYQPQAGGQVRFGHEEGDFNLRGIILFLVILVLSAVLTLIVAWALMEFFEWWEKNHEPKPTAVQQQLINQRGPEMAKTGVKPAPDWYSRAVDDKTMERTFATPRLQYDDAADMALFLQIEQNRLNNTGKDTDGNIFIPIDRAMDLVVKEGLPPVNGTFTVSPPLGNLEAVAEAAQKRLNEAQGKQPVRQK